MSVRVLDAMNVILFRVGKETLVTVFTVLLSKESLTFQRPPLRLAVNGYTRRFNIITRAINTNYK